MKTDKKEFPFVFYPSFRSQLRAIKNEKVRLLIYDALIDYGVCGTDPDFTDIDPLGTVDALFVPMRQEIDKAKARYFACVENGKKGGAPKGISNNPNGRRGNKKVEQSETNQELTQTNQELTQTNQELTQTNLDKDIDINIKKFVPKGTHKKSPMGILPRLLKKDYENIKNLWNEVCTNLPKIELISDKRKVAIRKTLEYVAKNFTQDHTTDQAADALGEIFTKINASNFLCGGSERGWKADFDWVMRDDHLIKILEGNYDNGKPKAATTDDRKANDEWG